MIYRIGHTVLKPLTHALYRPIITGTQNVPLDGPVILASNHRSFIDSFVIPLCAPRQVAFLAKHDYFVGGSPVKNLQKTFFEGVGAVPVDRDSPRAAQESLDLGLEVLRAGGAFALYPEGTRSRDGRLYRGRTGVGHLALTTGAPIVPVGLVGTENIQPVGSNRPRLAKVEVHFGRPIEIGTRFEGVPKGKARRQIADEVMASISQLVGQPVEPEYADRAGQEA